MKIGQKLIVGYVGIALLVGVVGVAGYSYMSKINKDVTKIVTGHLPEVEASLEMIVAFREQSEELHHYLIGRKQAKEEFAEFGEKFGVWTEKLKEKQGNPEHIKMREKAEKLHNEFERITKEIWKIYDSGDVKGALAKRQEASSLLKESASILEELKDAEVISANSKGETARKLTGRALQIFALAFGASILLALAMGYAISRSVSVPITKLKDAATDIAQGNMDAKIEVKPGDEIGELAEAFDNMRTSLKVVMEEYEKREKKE